MSKYRVVDQRTYRTRQAWQHVQYRKYGHKVVRRVHIERDAYDDQSKASVFQWSESEGWLLILSLPIQDTAVGEVSYVWEAEKLGTRFEDTAERLFSLASELLD